MQRGRQPSRHPYPGLRPFEADEYEFFFGRDKQIEEILERLATRSFVAILGGSGSGKSSLIRAGVIPALRRGAQTRRGANRPRALCRDRRG